MKILAIEDDAVYVSLLQAYIGRAGKGIFELETVSLLAQGLTKLGEKMYDAVLLDLQLPDSRGAGTVITVRREAPNVPIVVLTSSDNEQMAGEVFENGAQEYLVKGKTSVSGVFRALKVAAERKAVDDRLRECESALVNSSDLVIFTENFTFEDHFGPRIKYTSPSFLKCTGYAADEVLGKTFDSLFGEKTDQSTAAAVKQAFEKVSGIELEMVLYRKDRSPFWFMCTMMPVPDKNGFLSHWLIVGKEVTDEKRAQKSVSVGNGKAGVISDVKELSSALATAEQRLKLLQGVVQDQANMIQTLVESNQKLLLKLQSIMNEEI